MTTSVTVDLADIANIYPIDIPASAATVQLQSGMVIVHGWSVANTASAGAGEIDIYNGSDATQTHVGVILLQPGTSNAVSMGLPGILCDVGLTVVTNSASLRGALWVSRPVQ